MYCRNRVLLFFFIFLIFPPAAIATCLPAVRESDGGISQTITEHETPAGPLPDSKGTKGGVNPIILRGEVLECKTGDPIELAVVTVLETGSHTLSDSRGSFELILPEEASTVHLSIIHISYRQIPCMNVEVKRGLELVICLDWLVYEAPVIEVVAETEIKQPLLLDRIEMNPEDLSDGALSQTDPLFALKKLPQVSSGNDFDGRFSIHGSSPDANAFFLDGLLFPSPYHLGGLCSIYDAANIRRFYFSPLPLSAAVHGATGAVVEVETGDGMQQEEGNSFSLGLMSSSVSTRNFLADRSAFISLMARRSYVDLLYDAFGKNENVRIPNFFDVQANVLRSLGSKRYLKFGLLFSGDEAVISAGDVIGGGDGSEAEVVWHRRLDAYSISLASRDEGLSIWWGRVILALQPYQSSFEIGGSDDERMDWRGGRGTLRFDLSRLYGSGRINAGIFTSVSRIEYNLGFGRGFWLASRNENSAVRLDNDGWSFVKEGKKCWAYSGTYSEITWAGDKTGFRAGGRLEAFARTGELLLSPRLSLYRGIGKRSTILMSCGLFSRDPAEDFGNPAVTCDGICTEKSGQFMLGFRHELPFRTLLQVGGFIRRERDLPVEIEPAVFASGGKGRSNGFELGLERIFKRWSAVANYAYTNAERIDLPHTLAFKPGVSEDGIDNLVPVKDEPYWYTSPYECRHRFLLELSKNISDTFTLSMSWHMQSGRVFTPIEEVHERGVGGYIATEGPKMSDRLPAYSRIDIHADWTYPRGAIFVEVLNLTNNKNVFNLRYNEDYTRETYYRMLPIMPAFGVKIFF